MTLSGGKRKVNKSLKSWVAFVKKVQKEEKLSYKDAIHRAKVRKDKGEKWMTGGKTAQQVVGDQVTKVANAINHKMTGGAEVGEVGEVEEVIEDKYPTGEVTMKEVTMDETEDQEGGRRRRRTMRRSRGRGRARTSRRGRSRASRRR